MSALNNLPVNYWNPQDFTPYDPQHLRIPRSTALSRDNNTYPGGSPINPGYGYGTWIPLTDFNVGMARWLKPYTTPVGPTGYNTIPAKWNNNTQWIDPTAAMRYRGTLTDVPVVDLTASQAIQQYLANAKGM